MTHSVRSKSRRGIVWGIGVLLAVFALSALSGCGGGTRGTGDTRTAILGVVKDEGGAPLVGATVTQLETGDRAVADDEGVFALAVDLTGGAPTLLIESGDFEATTTIEGITPDPEGAPVSVQITVDRIEGIVSNVDVSIDAPSPTPTPGSGGTPRPTPTPSPGGKHLYTMNGRAIDSAGAPLDGIVFSIPGGSTSTSNGAGRFSLRVRTASPSVRINVVSGAYRGSLLINGLPTDRDAAISLTVQVIEPKPPALNGGAETEFEVKLSNVVIN